MSDISDAQSSQYFSEQEDSISQQPIRTSKKQKNLVVQRQPNDLSYHTLGNALRVLLSSDENVQFVGYSIPHPSQTKMNLRVQTTGEDTNKILNLGLRNIQSICKMIRTEFMTALNKV